MTEFLQTGGNIEAGADIVLATTDRYNLAPRNTTSQPWGRICDVFSYLREEISSIGLCGCEEKLCIVSNDTEVLMLRVPDKENAVAQKLGVKWKSAP